MKFNAFIFFFVFLLGCTPASNSLSSTLSSTDTLSSSDFDSLSANLSSSIFTTTSTSEIPSSVSSTSQNATLATIWLAPMGLNTSTTYYGENLPLTSALTQVKVTIAHAVYQEDGSLYGLAYEAVVDGNSGVGSIRFRVGITNNRFAGFIMVSHREHGTFGLRLIQALVSQLPQKTATNDGIQEILISANATRAGISQTYDGIIPALHAILIHYQSKIS